MFAWFRAAPRSASLTFFVHGNARILKHGSLFLGTAVQTAHSSFCYAGKCKEQHAHLSKLAESVESDETYLCAHIESISVDKRRHITYYLSSPELLARALDKVQPPFRHAEFVFFAALLRSCGSLCALAQGQLVHIHIIKCAADRTTFLQNVLLQMYGKCGQIHDAYMVFAKMQQHDQYSWNFMASAYTHSGAWDLALETFNRSCIEGFVVDEYVLTSSISACAGKEDLRQGKYAHSLLVGSDYETVEVVGNALLNLYGRCHCLSDVRIVFSKLLEKSVISWSSVITAYTRHNHGRDAISLWCRMEEEAIMPNRGTITGLIDACANEAALYRGKQAHCCFSRSSFENDDMVWTAAISMYGKCGDMENALKLFEQLKEPSVVSWTALMAGYAQHGQSKEAFEIFDKMQQNGIVPNEVTFVCILDAYNSQDILDKAKLMHACIKHSGFETNLVVGTALVKMYGNCGSPTDARALFDVMPQRNLVSWNTMLSVYAQHGFGKDAFRLFSLMLRQGVTLNRVSFISMLSVCADEGALFEGTWMHDQVVRRGYFEDVVVGNALLDMYTKCGQVNAGRNMFERLSERTVVSWNTMIPAYAYHGHGKEVLPMLRRMKKDGVHPNLATFKVILSACGHAGLVDEAHACLNAMNEIFEQKADRELYDRVIDLLGRTGRLDEVEDKISSMPLQPSLMSWLILLGACSSQADLERGEHIANQVFEMVPECTAPYVILSNMYVGAGRYSDAERLLSRMKAKGLMQQEECSFLGGWSDD
ncbi:hypothetical protein L7F22_060562 [Adiantum nelumboides]|nr:hypothetical protein [Adiantum nelumboides]